MFSKSQLAEQDTPASEDIAGYVAQLRQTGQVEAAGTLITSAQTEFPDVIELAVEHIWLAWTRHEGEEALRHCETLRATFPDNVTGYALNIMALRGLDRIEDAETLAEFALTRFAHEPSFRIERALLPFYQHRWDESIRRFSALRESFPTVVEGYIYGIAALRESGQFDAAEALADEAMDRFPSELGPAVEHVWVAWARQDWSEALRRCEQLRYNFPDHAAGFALSMMVLRGIARFEEAEKLSEFVLARFPNDSSLHLEWACVPLDQRRWDEAIRRFAVLREKFPVVVEGYTYGISALREAGRMDEAEALAESSMTRFGSVPAPAVEHVWIACARQDWPEALRRCEKLCDDFPNHAVGFTMSIMVLRSMDRIAEAQALAITAQARFPYEAPLWIEHALLPFHQSDWPEAISRFDEVRHRFPNTSEAYSYGAIALREAGQLDQAEHVIEAGMSRCPRVVQLWIERGMLAIARQDFSVAAERWAALREAFPYQLQGYVHGIEALRESGDFDAAESLAIAAMNLFPDRAEVAVEHAHIAAKRGDLQEALRRWTLIAERFPNYPGVQDEMYQVRLDAIGSEVPARVVLAVTERHQDNYSDLLLSFEGLGDNCEFGNVQRYFGAEPLSLLRWAGITPQDLIRALENRFAGFGDPATTKLWITEPGPDYAGGEYFIRDEEHGFFMHSFVSIREVKEEKFLQQTCRRMQFLRDKLVSDLTSGEKIFLYKRRDGAALTDDERAALHTGVRSYGPSTLLCVQLSDDAHPNGFVEKIREGLLVGYIDRLVESANSSHIAYESWLGVCRSARSLAPGNKEVTS